jgi:hypothetical protein
MCGFEQKWDEICGGGTEVCKGRTTVWKGGRMCMLVKQSIRRGGTKCAEVGQSSMRRWDDLREVATEVFGFGLKCMEVGRIFRRWDEGGVQRRQK